MRYTVLGVMRVPSRKRSSAQSRRYPKVGWRRIKSAIRTASGSLIVSPRDGLGPRRRTLQRATQGSDIADAGTPRGSRRSLVGRLRGKRAVFARLLQNIEVEDELADLLLELLDLFILQGVLVLGACPQRILGPEQEPVPPLLHLGHRQPMLPGRGLGRGLTLQDAEDQRCPPLRGPALRGLRTLVCHDPPPAVIQSRLVGGLNSEGSSIWSPS